MPLNCLSSRLAIGFSCLGHAYMHVLAALYLTVVLTLEHEWRLSYDALLRLWTLGSLLIGLGAPLAGWCGDRWGESRMMVVFFLLTGVGAIAAGLADGTTALMLGLAVLGLGASIYHPVGMSWVIRNAVNRGRAMGVLGIFGSLGVATAATVAAVLSELIDWRAAFLVPGAICIATGLVLWALVVLGLVVDGGADARPEPPPARGDIVRAFLILSVTMACGAITFNSLQIAMPKLFEERLGSLAGGGVLGIGALVTAVYLLGALSQVSGGWLADRVPVKSIYLAGLVLQVPLLLLASRLFEGPLLAVAALVVFIASVVVPAENLLLARYTPSRHRGLAYGMKFVLSFGVAPLAVWLVAASHDWQGDFAPLLWVLAGAAAIAWLAALLLPQEGRGRALPVTAVVAAGPAE